MSRGKGKRYAAERIVLILDEIEAGATVAETCRKHGVTGQTIYRWTIQTTFV